MIAKIVILVLTATHMGKLQAEEGDIESYVGCEKERVAFKCSDKMAPDIISAIWGVQEGASCPIPDNDDMTCSADVVNEVRDKCQLKKCAFSPNKRQLGEPCSESGKPIVKIVYQCRPIPTTTLEPPVTTTTTTTTPAPPAGTDGDLRLVDGDTPDEGLIQIYRNGQWGNICDIGFKAEYWPSMACVDMGYSGAVDAVYAIERDPSYIGSYPINYESPACRQDPTHAHYAESFTTCHQDDDPACSHDKDVYVKCSYYTDGDLRLADGDTSDEGLIQIYRNGQWGNICDIGFKAEYWPSMACVDMGYSGALDAFYAVDKDPNYVGSYPINFESPACRQDPTHQHYAESFATCHQDDDPACSHDKDVYVKCG